MFTTTRARVSAAAGLLAILAVTALGADRPSSSSIPSVDAGLGKCWVEFTVVDSAGKPVYNARIRVHIAYGFMSVRKLDLEVGTNADGKARFDGLPAKVKQPLQFMAAYEDMTGSAVFDPAGRCQAEHQITLEKRP